MNSLICLLLYFTFLKFALRNKKETQKKYIYFVFVQIKQKSSNFIGNMISIDMILNTL